jgi:hypothetical protein
MWPLFPCSKGKTQNSHHAPLSENSGGANLSLVSLPCPNPMIKGKVPPHQVLWEDFPARGLLTLMYTHWQIEVGQTQPGVIWKWWPNHGRTGPKSDLLFMPLGGKLQSGREKGLPAEIPRARSRPWIQASLSSASMETKLGKRLSIGQVCPHKCTPKVSS